MGGLDLTKIPMDLIMNIINIVILFVIVRFLAYKPVKKFLDARRAGIDAEKKEAEDAENRAKEMCAQYEAKLSETDAARADAVKSGEREGQRKADEIVAGAKKDAEKLISDAKKNIAAKEAESRENMRDSVVDLSLSIATKVIGRNLCDDDNKRLAEEFFAEECGKAKDGSKNG